MTLRDLFPDINLKSPDLGVSGITADSRKVSAGSIFAALRGVQADGRDYIPQAIANGAIAVLGHDLPSDLPVPAIDVEEPRLALAQISAQLYPEQPETMIAVTGTNGKSSTVDFLRQIWEHMGKRAASLGTLGAVGPSGAIDLGHTTPDPVAIHQTLQSLAADGVTHAAMEASSHGLAQYRLDAVKLVAAAFTNLTQDHLDYHPSFEEYRDAKLRLVKELLPAKCPVIINADSDERESFKQAGATKECPVISVGWRGADLKISELMPRAHGQKLFLNWRGEEAELDLPLIGEFQALNALTAAGLALALGDPFDAVLAGMAALRPVKGRMEFVGETANGAGVFVDYAHTPDGLDTLLRAARPHTAGQLILVFGAGGDRDRTKRPLMGGVAAKHADQVIVTDDNPRSEVPETIRSAILAAAPDAAEIGDRRSAIFEGVRRLKAGDTLLIAGKGHETGQTVGDKTLPFSDQDTALAALAGEAE
ncbi:MAG: UDP-N-acetylmuramoyl-L-alanyl-D-glutamate--2,6-diaminopimelate ligase [Hyphomonadaceae bacterium]